MATASDLSLRRSPAQAAVPRRVARRPPFASRQAWPAFAVCCFNAAVVMVGVARGAIGYASDDLTPVYVVVVLLWCFGWAAHVLGARRIGAIGQALAIFATLSATTSLASAVLATTALPYADTLLAGLDAQLFGVRWPAMIAGFRAYPHGLRCLSFAYSSLNWQPLLMLAVLISADRPGQAWRFLTAFAVALWLSLAVFPFFPALAGYVAFGIGPETVPGVVAKAAWHGPAILAGLRDGTIATLDARALSGIITMPSFHAAAAILLAVHWARIGRLGLPGLALNAAMLVSAVPVGGHYLVDLVAGAMVAMIAIGSAAWAQHALASSGQETAARSDASAGAAVS